MKAQAEYRVEWRMKLGAHTKNSTPASGPADEVIGCLLWRGFVVGDISKSNAGKWRFRFGHIHYDSDGRGHTRGGLSDPGINVTKQVRSPEKLLQRILKHVPASDEDAAAAFLTWEAAAALGLAPPPPGAPPKLRPV